MVMNISCKFEKGSCNTFFIKCENISKKGKNGLGEVLWWSMDDLQVQISACLQRTYIYIYVLNTSAIG